MKKPETLKKIQQQLSELEKKMLLEIKKMKEQKDKIEIY